MTNAPRVLATDAARRAAERMRTLTERNLQSQLRQVVTLGATLANPRVWDGREAAAFRSGWPRTSQSVVGALASLRSLSAQGERVIGDITRAGSAGALQPGALALVNVLTAVLLGPFGVAGRFEARGAALERLAAAAIRIGGTIGHERQGTIGEEALLQLLAQRGAPAFDLNMLRRWFPLLDTISRDGLFSAKTSLVDDRVARYVGWFQDLFSRDRQLAAARELLRNPELAAELELNGMWPVDLARNAGRDDLVRYIKDAARLAIPDDQVGAVRTALRSTIRDLSGNFGFADGVRPTGREIGNLVRRVVGMGITTEDLARLAPRAIDAGRAATLAADTARTATASAASLSSWAKALKVGGNVLGAVGAVGDVWTFADPSPNAWGGPELERGAAAVSFVGTGATLLPGAASLLGINAVADWVPGVGEVVMGVTAAYFVGDLIYQNRQAVEGFVSGAGHTAASVTTSLASDAAHGVQNGLGWLGSHL